MLASDQLEDVHQARTAQLERQAREDLQRRLLGELRIGQGQVFGLPRMTQRRERLQPAYSGAGPERLAKTPAKAKRSAPTPPGWATIWTPT